MRKKAVVGILLLLSCCDSAKQTLNGSDSHLTIAYRSLVSSLDPIQENTVVSNSIYCNIFEALVQRDENMKIVPALAVAWSNPNDRTCIFKIRRGVRFHDGTLLRPEDVRFSLERARKEPSSQLSSSLTMLEKVEVTGADVVRITTRKSYSTLLNKLADIWILPEHYSSRPSSHLEYPPGTGPYRVKESKRDESLLLERNDKYWGKKAAIPHVHLQMVPDLKQRIQGLLQGKFQILPFLEASALQTKSLRESKNVKLQSAPGLLVLYLGMDVARTKTPYVDLPVNPFQDIRVRKAIYHAVNIKSIIHDILKGYAKEATQLVAPKVLGYNAQIERLGYDPQTARELMKQTEYRNGFRVRLDTTNNRYQNDVQIGQAIVRDLAAIGIQVRLNAMDKDVLTRVRGAGDSSFYMVGWMDPSADASSAFEFLIHSPDPSHAFGIGNTGGYSNPDVDRLIERSSEAMDPADRIRLLEKAMEMTMEDYAFIPLHVENDITAISSNVQWQPRTDELLTAAAIRWN